MKVKCQILCANSIEELQDQINVHLINHEMACKLHGGMVIVNVGYNWRYYQTITYLVK
jgi:hypothetical protein